MAPPIGEYGVVIWNILAIGAAVLYLAALVYAFVQIVKSPDLAPIERLVWIVAIICFPLIGSIVWFAAGPHPFGIRLTRDLP